jgi:hypothetical protein
VRAPWLTITIISPRGCSATGASFESTACAACRRTKHASGSWSRARSCSSRALTPHRLRSRRRDREARAPRGHDAAGGGARPRLRERRAVRCLGEGGKDDRAGDAVSDV